MKTLEERRKEGKEKIKKDFKIKNNNIYVCMSDDMHPYNCDGVFGGRCIHCESRVEKGHNPKICALCNYLD